MSVDTAFYKRGEARVELSEGELAIVIAKRKKDTVAAVPSV